MSDHSDRIDQATAAHGRARVATDQYNRSLEQNNNTINRLLSLGDKITTSTSGTSNAFGQLGQAAEDVGGKVRSLGVGLGAIASNIPGVGGALGGLTAAVGLTAAGFGTALKASQALAHGVMDIFDGPSQQMRAFDKDLFNLNKRFGGSIEESQRFADSIKTETNTQFARSLYMTRGEIHAFAQATAATNLTQQQLTETVMMGTEAVQLQTVATAYARATGLDNGKAVSLLNTLMNKQGKTAEEAAKMMGMYAGTASEVGMSVESVSSTLNDAVSGFTKLGLSADFGKPMLEGFASVMNDMGLGIENSIDLTKTLTAALAGLSTNYAMAHVMFSRGGLEMGGSGSSGALGASIGLQAAQLQADRTGDQAELGSTLMRGMRDTLTSFTGGDIVTVEDAAADSSLQTQFYTQQQMLTSQFGIQDPASANRVLDLLAQLEDATRSGDVDAQRSLEEQLAREQQGTDQTLDEWAKANANLEIQSNLLAVIARPGLTAARAVARTGREWLDDKVNSVGSQVQSGARTASGGVVAAVENMGIDIDSSVGRILSGSGTPSAVQTAVSDRLSDEVASGDSPGVARSGAQLNPNLRNPNANMAQEIERAASMAARSATTSAIQEAGFLSRDEFADAVAAAMTTALSDNLSINVELTPAASEFIQTTRSVNSQVANING